MGALQCGASETQNTFAPDAVRRAWFGIETVSAVLSRRSHRHSWWWLGAFRPARKPAKHSR